MSIAGTSPRPVERMRIATSRAAAAPAPGTTTIGPGTGTGRGTTRAHAATAGMPTNLTLKQDAQIWNNFLAGPEPVDL